MRVLEPREIVQLLRAEVKKAGSQGTWAKRAGIDRSFVNKIIHGRKQPTKNMILALGLRIVVLRDADIQKLRPTKKLEFDVKDVVKLLHEEVRRAGSAAAFAKIAGVDRATVNRVLHGLLPPSPKIVHALGLRTVFCTQIAK
jgi:DNA-binding phage protein